MKRSFTEYLLDWKDRMHRKPLIVRGARQVGKTYTIDKFGKDYFTEVIKINFEETPDLQQFFKTNDVKQIVRNLEVYYGRHLVPGHTLLFLDEIQTCPEAIVTLRYFYEKLPEIHVIAAGSLLDHTLSDLQYSMPVGRVEFAYMYPLQFYEFLDALNEGSLVKYLKTYIIREEIPQAIHRKLLSLVRLYYVVGGMPEAVKTYTETNSFLHTGRVHESIIKSLEYDFSKYGTRSQQLTMIGLLKYLPKATGQKFKYSNFDRTIRSDTIRRALDLLSMSRICTLVHNTRASGVPLESGAVDNIFKTLFLDIGLSNHVLKIRSADMDNFSLTNEGSLAEQFIGQELLCQAPCFVENTIFYWMREQRNSEAEIDYLIQSGNRILPVEVKSGTTGTLKSLQVFVTERKLSKAIRFNADLPNVSQVQTSIRIGKGMKEVDFKLISLPLYMVREFDRFL